MIGLMVAGFSNLICTLLVILLYGDKTKNKYLLTHSLASSVVMILNMKILKIFKFELVGWGTSNKEETIKNRINSLMRHIERFMGTNFLIPLSIGIGL